MSEAETVAMLQDDARTARETALLHDLVAIPSLSKQEQPAVEFLCAQMQKLGFSTTIDAVGNAIGKVGSGPREIVLLGHIDTVPGNIPVQIADDTLHGRGAVDAKGPLATFVCAAARAAEAGLNDWRLTVIGAVDEEGDSTGAHYAVNDYAPTYALIGEPSGWESVVLGYRGSMAVKYHLHQPSAHSGAPVPTAPQVAINFWNEVVTFAAASNTGCGATFDQLEPNLQAMNTHSDGLYDEVNLRIGFRLPPHLDGKALVERLLEFAAHGVTIGSETTVTIDASEALPAFRAEKKSPLVRAFLPAIRAAGGRPRFKVKTGTADMNIVGPVWGCPIVAYGPGDSKLDHTPYERLALTDYQRAIGILTTTLQTLTAR